MISGNIRNATCLRSAVPTSDAVIPPLQACRNGAIVLVEPALLNWPDVAPRLPQLPLVTSALPRWRFTLTIARSGLTTDRSTHLRLA